MNHDLGSDDTVLNPSRLRDRRLIKSLRALPLARKAKAAYRSAQMQRLFPPGERNDRPRFLFWVPGGMPLMLHVEGPLAAALRMRGADVHAVICDGRFRACVRREVNDGVPVELWDSVCIPCRRDTSQVLDEMGISYSFIGDHVSEASVAALRTRTANIRWADLDALEHQGVPLGSNVRSAVIRYLQGDGLEGHEEVVPEYAWTATVVAEAAANALGSVRPHRVFMSHGIYVDWGPALRIAMQQGVPVAAWMASYLTGRFYLRHLDDTSNIDFHALSAQAWQSYRDVPLTTAESDRLDRFLHRRYRHHEAFDMKRLYGYSGNTSALRKRLVGDDGRPVWAVLCHINWDQVADYSPMAYPTFDDWTLDTIDEISRITSARWLIKIHPAEAWDNPSTGVQALIDKMRAPLPSHVSIVPAEEEISPMDFFQLIDGAVTVYGTPGLEVALMGKPVILAGESHYGDKGFTYDAPSVNEYRTLLGRVPQLAPLTDAQRELARRYAYAYFIRRQIPLPPVRDPATTWWRFDYSRRKLLAPGNDPFVDFICDRLMSGEDFLLDDRLVELAEGFEAGWSNHGGK